MNMNERLEFNNDIYRDDRIFVMSIAPAKDSDGKACWNLVTYRNSMSLPPVRNDFFTTEIELMEYIKKWEPTTPLISNDEKPLEIPNNINCDDIDAIWRHYNEWLIERNLFSAVTGISHVPYYVDKRGFTEKPYHVIVEKI